MAIVQVLLRHREPRLTRFLPSALSATATAFVAGTGLLLAAELRWVPGATLDDLAPFVVVAALWWMVRNRMGSARNRRAVAPTPPG